MFRIYLDTPIAPKQTPAIPSTFHKTQPSTTLPPPKIPHAPASCVHDSLWPQHLGSTPEFDEHRGC